jgi:hypothetical protein
MAGLEAPWELMESSPERGRRIEAGGTPGEGEGCRGHHGNLTKRAKGVYKNVSNVQNLIFKQNLFEFKRILFIA